jgi:hypothetical protein
MKKLSLSRILILAFYCCIFSQINALGQNPGGIHVHAGYGVSRPELFEKESGRKLAPYYLAGVAYSHNSTFGPSFGITVDRRDTKSKNSSTHAFYNYFNFEAGAQWKNAHNLSVALGGYWGPFIGGKITRDGTTFEQLRYNRYYEPSYYDLGAWLDISTPLGANRFRAFFKSRIGFHPYVTNNTHNTFALGLAMKVFDVK